MKSKEWLTQNIERSLESALKEMTSDGLSLLVKTATSEVLIHVPANSAITAKSLAQKLRSIKECRTIQSINVLDPEKSLQSASEILQQRTTSE